MDAAVFSGRVEIVKSMIEKYHPEKKVLIKATFEAVTKGDLPIVTYLLTQNVSLFDSFNGHQLYQYISHLHRDHLEDWVLLFKQKEWQVLWLNCQPIADYAVETENAKLLQALLLVGLDPNFLMASGVPALDFAHDNGLGEIELILRQFKSVIDYVEF